MRNTAGKTTCFEPMYFCIESFKVFEVRSVKIERRGERDVKTNKPIVSIHLKPTDYDCHLPSL